MKTLFIIIMATLLSSQLFGQVSEAQFSKDAQEHLAKKGYLVKGLTTLGKQRRIWYESQWVQVTIGAFSTEKKKLSYSTTVEAYYQHAGSGFQLRRIGIKGEKVTAGLSQPDNITAAEFLQLISKHEQGPLRGIELLTSVHHRKIVLTSAEELFASLKMSGQYEWYLSDSPTKPYDEHTADFSLSYWIVKSGPDLQNMMVVEKIRQPFRARFYAERGTLSKTNRNWEPRFGNTRLGSPEVIERQKLPASKVKSAYLWKELEKLSQTLQTQQAKQEMGAFSELPETFATAEEAANCIHEILVAGESKRFEALLQKTLTDSHLAQPMVLNDIGRHKVDMWISEAFEKEQTYAMQVCTACKAKVSSSGTVYLYNKVGDIILSMSMEKVFAYENGKQVEKGVKISNLTFTIAQPTGSKGAAKVARIQSVNCS